MDRRLDKETLEKINASMAKDVFSSGEKFRIGVMDPKGKNPNPFTKQPYSEQYKYTAETGNPKSIANKTEKEIKDLLEKGKGEGWAHGTVYKDNMKIFKLLTRNQVILLTAKTGSGKTVAFPKLLSHYFGYRKNILITIPTTKSTKSSAIYAATCMDSELGKHVGYVYGAESNYKNWTKQLYATDGWAQMYMTSNPELENYGGIILDEIHIRNISQDVLLSMVCDLALRRPDFKIIVMSATIDTKPYEAYFARLGLLYDLYEPEVNITNYPVDNIFYPKNVKPNEIQDPNNGLLMKTLIPLLQSNETGDIIIFVTSGTAGNKLKKAIDMMVEKNPSLYPLLPWVSIFESKTDDEVKKYIFGESGYNYRNFVGEKYNRRVIFSTPAAEFGITIEKDVYGVPLKWVIDTGLRHAVSYDAKQFAIVRGDEFVSRDSIQQRCGRVGRVAPGVCIRIYSKDQYDNKFIKHTVNKIEESDITSDFLGIMSLPNINNFSNTLKFFRNMISPPPEDNIKVAAQNLTVNKLMYGLNDPNVGKLTPMAKICSSFGKYGVEIGRMLIASYYFGCMKECLILAAITFTALTGIGIDDFFKINKETKEIEEKQMKHISKYYHPYGEHFTLFNVYAASRNPLIFDVSEDEPSKNKKSSKRDEWAKHNYINYLTLLKVDEAYVELYEKFTSLYAQIRLGNFFKIKDFPEHEAFKREMKRTPFAPQMGGGVVLYQRGSMPSYFFSKKDGTTLEELLQEPAEEYEFVMAGGKKKNKKPFVKKSIITSNVNTPTPKQPQKQPQQQQQKKQKKPFVKKEPEKDRVLGTKDNYIKKYMVEVKKEDSEKKLFQEKLADYQEKDRLEKQLKRNQKQMEEYIKTSGRQEGATTPKDKAYNILDKINLFEIDECKEISRFKSIQNNMAVCLFYGYHTHIASYIRDGNNQSMNYLVKNIDPKKPYITASIKKTIFQIRNERPSVIIYGKCTIMNNMATFSLVSKLPLNIIKKLVHTLPQ